MNATTETTTETIDTITTAEGVIDKYEEMVRSNRSDEWDTVTAVAHDEDGECVWEAWDVATEMGVPLTDDMRDAIGDALYELQHRFLAEIGEVTT